MGSSRIAWKHWLREIPLWAIALLLAFAFVGQGISKFPDEGGWAKAFNHWGLPVWFRWLTGVLELSGGLLVLAPPLARYGAGLIACVMVGAAGVHVTHGEWERLLSNGMGIAFCALLAWGRWNSSFRRRKADAMTADAILALTFILLPGTIAAREEASPGVDRIFAAHVRAAGGADAIAALKSRTMKGRLVAPGGSAPLEIYEKDPGRFLVVIDSPASGLSRNAFDGTTAWSQNPQKGLRVRSGPEVENFKREYDLHWEIRLPEFYPSASLRGKEKEGAADVYVVEAKAPDGTREVLYFDVASSTTLRSTTRSSGCRRRPSRRLQQPDERQKVVPSGSLKRA